LKLKGSANVELPSALVSSFFRPLFENIKNKVKIIIKGIIADTIGATEAGKGGVYLFGGWFQ
jgi:hypothetical protein